MRLVLLEYFQQFFPWAVRRKSGGLAATTWLLPCDDRDNHGTSFLTKLAHEESSRPLWRIQNFKAIQRYLREVFVSRCSKVSSSVRPTVSCRKFVEYSHPPNGTVVASMYEEK
jgi:hypothetical protein